MKSVHFQQKHFALNIHISQSNAGNQMYLFSSNSNASGVMCTANTKTNTKQVQGVQGKCPIRPVYEK
jgi:hypothetical protein